MSSKAVDVPDGKYSEVTFENDAEGGKEVNERGEWGGKLEFLLTCIGYAVGLGNVWRFPYMCYKNGGGAFIIPYFTMLALVGLPLFFLELAFGQFASLGPTAIWNVSPILKGLGYAMVITNTLVALYYCVIIGWSMFYLFASMTTQLPWEHCGNWWNTPLCFESKDFVNVTGNITVGNMSIPRELIKTPSEEFYYNKVLRQSASIDDTGDVRWDIAACLLLCWAIVYLVLIKGISSLGKVVYFTSTFPYVLLTVMLIRGVTLDGAVDGILYYLKPNFSRLADAKVWNDAATQIFYNLSACTGGLIAMASYNKFKNNCLRDSVIVPIINALTSFYAGFVIFSVLGFMAKQKGVSIDDVAASGPGLVFVVYPEALSQMPVAPLWAMLFFLMLLTLGFSSQFSMVECFFASLTDEFPDVLRKSRFRQAVMRIGCILVFFIISYPMVTQSGLYWFNLIDSYVGGFPLLFIGFFEAIAISHIYGYKRFADDIYMMLGKKPHKYFRICWCFVSPGILLFLIIFMAIQYEPLTLFGTYKYPDWSLAIGWLIVLFPLGFIPIIFVIRVLLDGGWQIIKKASLPLPSWGPALSENRAGIYARLNSVSSQKNIIQCDVYDDKDSYSQTCNGSSVDSNKSNQITGVNNLAFSTSAL